MDEERGREFEVTCNSEGSELFMLYYEDLLKLFQYQPTLRANLAKHLST